MVHCSPVVVWEVQGLVSSLAEAFADQALESPISLSFVSIYRDLVVSSVLVSSGLSLFSEGHSFVRDISFLGCNTHRPSYYVSINSPWHAIQ